MKKLSLIFKSLAVFSAIAVMTTFTSCKNNSGNGLLSQSGIDSLRDGVMIEEYLFWDNQSYMNQIGLGK
jgi:hypothetical protein